VIVAIVAAVVDLRGAIGFSSFGVLLYYGIANVAAFTLTRDEGRPPRVVPVVGLVGCLLLAGSLPLEAMLTGTAVVGLGALLHGGRTILQNRTASR
jgi:APA family basic amino acid/polyamine antiporter